MEAYYIDPENGDDMGTGITPARPLKTFDAAVDKSKGVGTYYLMNDYQFGMTGYDIVVSLAKVYPYQKNIRLSAADGYNQSFIKSYYGLTMGDAQSEHSFIIDSITVNETLFDVESGSLALNNVKVSKSTVGCVGYAELVTVNNCEFTNNTVEGLLVFMNEQEGNTSILKNTTIKDCHGKLLVEGVSSFESNILEIDNCQITSNVLTMPPFILYNMNLHLKSGSWQYNTLSDIPTGVPFAAKLNKSNLAGIYALGTTVNFYKDFTMDMNNYIMIDTLSVVNVAENLTGSQIATILPIDFNDGGDLILGYKEGRQVLTGTRNMLNANYQKFALAQVADDIWYLRADGKIYLTPVGIKEDVLANTVIYPNPVTDQMTVRISNVDVTDLTVIDAYGRLVMTSKVSGDTEILNLSNLSSGMYFVQFRDHNTILGTQKIIKK